MSSEIQTLEALLHPLLSVLIGGFIAIFGGVVTQILVHKLNNKREKRKLLLEKGESLVESLHAYSEWIDHMSQKALCANEYHDNKPSPLLRAWAIQTLYFPDLIQPMLNITETGQNLVQFCTQKRIAQLKEDKQWVSKYNDEFYIKKYSEYDKAFMSMLSKISESIKS